MNSRWGIQTDVPTDGVFAVHHPLHLQRDVCQVKLSTSRHFPSDASVSCLEDSMSYYFGGLIEAVSPPCPSQTINTHARYGTVVCTYRCTQTRITSVECNSLFGVHLAQAERR